MINSKKKGKSGEREWSKYLREIGFVNARRGQQYKGTPNSPDVVDGIPGTHCEVKRVERLNINKAINQAMEDCGDLIPYVAHRRNRGEWLITIRAEDIKRFSSILISGG